MSRTGSASWQAGEWPWLEHAFDFETAAQKLRFQHQRHQPAAGDRELRLGASEQAQVFLARRHVQAALRLLELLAGGLLADAHPPCGVDGIALDVVERAEPPGEQRLDRLRLLVDD